MLLHCILIKYVYYCTSGPDDENTFLEFSHFQCNFLYFHSEKLIYVNQIAPAILKFCAQQLIQWLIFIYIDNVYL